jgi:branched-chain amino acid transport system permease protein
MPSPALGIQLLINGVATGLLYALLAIGFTLVWKSVAVPNFAQGDFAAVGMFAALTIYGLSGGSILAALAGAPVAAVAVGALTERLAIRPLQQADAVAKIVATLGVGMIISNGLRLIYGPMPRPFPPFIGLGVLRLGPVVLVEQYVGTAAFLITLIVLLQTLFHRTMVGKALRAVADNRDVASLMGIDRDRFFMLAFALSAALGATAGVFIAPFVFVTPGIGFNLLLKALLAAVIGGFGSYPGALLGGVLIGVVDNLSAFYISSDFRDVVSFAILIVVLMVRPVGLLGTSVREI